MSDRIDLRLWRTLRSLRTGDASISHYTQAAWSLLGNSGQQVLSFGIFALLARFLDPRQLGLIAICHLINQGVRTIVIDSLAIPTTRKPSLSDEDASWSLTFISAIAVLFALALIAGADVVEWLFRAPGFGPVLRAMALVVVISGLSRVYESRLVRSGSYRLLALRSRGAIVAGGLVAVPMAIHGFGVWALVGQQLTYETVQLIIAALSERRTWRPRLVWSGERLRWNVRESMTLFAGAAPNFAAAAPSQAREPWPATGQRGLQRQGEQAFGALDACVAAQLDNRHAVDRGRQRESGLTPGQLLVDKPSTSSTMSTTRGSCRSGRGRAVQTVVRV